MNDWIEARPDGAVIKLLILPKASRTEIVGLHGTPPRLKIRVAAPPVDGEANDELIRLLRKKLKLTTDRIGIVRGKTGKAKDVVCRGVGVEELRRQLLG